MGKDNYTDNDTDNDTLNLDNEEPKSFDREYLKNNYNGKQLASMCEGKTNLRISTLERMGKDKLIDILQGNLEEKKSKPRATRTVTETDELIQLSITTLESIKRARLEDEKAELSKIIANMYKSSSVGIIDEMRSNNKIDKSKMNKIVFGGSTIMLLIDSFIGFSNIPNLFGVIFGKIKAKFSNKK